MALRPVWLQALRGYLLALGPMMLAWEAAQLPLYTLWRGGSWFEIIYTILHCTVGDMLIGLAALTWALVLVGTPEWPRSSFVRVGLAATCFGIAYTIYSEWVNVEMRQSWRYTDAMPRVPLLGTGLAPLLQWLVLPAIALRAAWLVGSRRVVAA